MGVKMEKKLLFVNACVRSISRTHRLAEALESRFYDEYSVEEVNLFEISLPMLDEEGIKARDEALLKGDFSDPRYDLAKQFSQADRIIIAAPYWDLSFPAVLKQYLETVSVNGITFCYSSEGVPQGLCRAEKLYYVTTSGGEIGNFNYGYDYVKALVIMLFGVKDTVCIRAVGLDVNFEDSEAILENAINNMKTLEL